MIYINLLPVRQIKKKIQAQKRILGMVVTLLCVLGVLGLVAMVLGFKVDELNATISTLQQERAKYQTTINQIEQLKKDQALLETKLNTISELKKNSQLTVRVMDELAKLVPSNRLWVTSLSFSGNYLRLSSIALDNATIADFMEIIVTSPFFVSAEISGTSAASYGGRTLRAFSMTIGVVNADFQEKEEETAAK